MSYIGNEERENKEKQLRRHTAYNRSNDPIENLSRVEDAMTMVNAMKEESGFVLKQGAVNRVIDPSYREHHKSTRNNDMIFHPDDLQNQLADDFFSNESNDMQYIKTLSYKEKKALLKELEKLENPPSSNNNDDNTNRSLTTKNKSRERERASKQHRSSRRARSISGSSPNSNKNRKSRRARSISDSSPCSNKNRKSRRARSISDSSSNSIGNGNGNRSSRRRGKSEKKSTKKRRRHSSSSPSSR